MAGLLFLNPVLKEMIWGGNRLREEYGFACKDGTGECWLVSAHEHGMGTVAGGEYDGKTLKEMWEQHASANVETRGESVFAARNAIDGVLANSSHGSWPYQSWGINRNDQAEMTLEFGRKVDFDRIVLYTRADFPHDNWWTSATFTFSDGTQETVHMQKSARPHMFAIQKNGITWIRLGNLIKADDPSPFPALTQLEVYGTEHRTEGEQR